MGKDEEDDKWERKVERLDSLAHSDGGPWSDLPFPAVHDLTVAPSNSAVGWDVVRGPWLIAVRAFDRTQDVSPTTWPDDRLLVVEHHSTQRDAATHARDLFDHDPNRGVLIVLGRIGQFRYRIVRPRPVGSEGPVSVRRATWR